MAVGKFTRATASKVAAVHGRFTRATIARAAFPVVGKFTKARIDRPLSGKFTRATISRPAQGKFTRATLTKTTPPASGLRVLIGGQLKTLTLGRGPIVPTTPPSSFIHRTTKPDSTNTGVPAGTTLTVISTPVTVTTAGTVYNNTQFDNWVDIQAANVTFNNCLFRGPAGDNSSAQRGLVNCTAASCVNANFNFCTFRPQSSSSGMTGLVGHDWTATRCHIYDVNDATGTFNTASAAGSVNCYLIDTYCHSLAWYNPSPWNSDGHTHNDCCQNQGPGGIVIDGSTLLANVSKVVGQGGNTDGKQSPYGDSVTGQAVGVTPNVKAVGATHILWSWLDYGAQSITMVPNTKGTGSDIRIEYNRFGRHQPQITKDGVRASRPIGIHPSVVVTGWPTAGTAGASFKDTYNGNTYEDDGTPVDVYWISG